MKKTFLTVLTVLIFSCIMAADSENHFLEPGHLPAPEFMPGFYDHFTNNYLNAKQAGMGATGVSLSGGIEYSLRNPASYIQDNFSSYIEVNVKGSTREMISYRYYSPETEPQKLQAVEKLPAGMLALGYRAQNFLNLGFSYSIPQTARYDIYARWLPVGVYLDRWPEMVNHQLTFTVNLHSFNFLQDLSVGLNILYNIYQFNATRIEYTFDKVNYKKSVLRLQPGLLYKTDQFSIGLTFITKAEEDFEIGNVQTWHTYETTIPASFALGFSYVHEDLTWAAEAQYEMYSDQHDQKLNYVIEEPDGTFIHETVKEKYSDRLTIKAGVEKDFEVYKLRGGIIFMPGIYRGAFRLPSAHDHDPAFGDYPSGYMYGRVENTDQLLLTFGASYNFDRIELSGAVLTDVLGNVDLFQMVAGLGFNF